MEGLLYLEDGSVFTGKGFGACGTRVGELVFSTAMTGYQELLTDPSCQGQIITMTYPLIGNCGVSEEDNESGGIRAFGAVIRDLCGHPSNHRSTGPLDRWMEAEGVPGICGTDTRMITKKLRREGTLKCVLSTEGLSEEEARNLCASEPLRRDYMKRAGTQTLRRAPGKGKKVAVMDFGVKDHILRELSRRDCDLFVFPYGTAAEELLAVRPDGLFLTEGPGDPAEAREAVEEVRKLMEKLPVFGIGLGHQILALAAGGQTYKLPHGHRGSNHGVYDKDTGRSYITAQNHGYAVKAESIILKGMEITHLNLNDGTVEGMRHRDLPVFSVQFCPETREGADGSGYLFDRFVQTINERSL